MPQTFYTEEEHREIVVAMEKKLMSAAQLLSEKVSRAEFAPSIGGFGCIYKPNAESEYCLGCPSTDFCPSRIKSWPK